MVQLELPIQYAIVAAFRDHLIAIKMDAALNGPSFVLLDQRSTVRNQKDGAEVIPWDRYKVGDSVAAEDIVPIKDDKDMQIGKYAPEWPRKGAPEPLAVVTRAYHLSFEKRTSCLAFVSYVGRGRSPMVRFYCPYSFAEKTLPVSKLNRTLKPHDLVRVFFVEHPKGTRIHAFNCYMIPQLAPYSPPKMHPSREAIYEAVSFEKLDQDELEGYQSFLSDPKFAEVEHMAIEEMLLSGGAMMQCRINQELQLGRTIVHPKVVRESADDATFEATYVPFGNDLRKDRARAARVLKEGNRILVRPVDNDGGHKENHVLATVRYCDILLNGTLQFEFSVPKYIAQREWGSLTERVGDAGWAFKATPSSVMTWSFRKKLMNGTIESLAWGSDDVKPSASIIKALFQCPKALPALEEAERPTPRYLVQTGQTLTKEQCTAVAYAVEPSFPLKVIAASAGSGKTTSAAAIVTEHLRKSKEEGRPANLLITSSMNAAIDSLAAKLGSNYELGDTRILVLQSATYLNKRSVKDPYQKYRFVYLLSELATGRLVEGLNSQEIQIAKNAARVAQYRFEDFEGLDWSLAVDGAEVVDEKTDLLDGLKVLVKHWRPEVILGTTSTLKNAAEALEGLVDNIVLDEAGTVALHEMVDFLVIWQNVKSLTAIGDMAQLENFAAQMPVKWRRFGFWSVLRHACENRDVPQIMLTEVFRSHPRITSVVSQFGYAKAPLTTKLDHAQRNLLERLALPLPRTDFPIVVLNVEKRHTETPLMSYTNDEQNKVAVQLAASIAAKGPAVDVRLMSLYGGSRDDIRKALRNLSLKYQSSAIDAVQGMETDIAIITTAFTPEEGTFGADSFVGKTNRLLVAISRARHGLFIIGNVSALRRIEEWARLFDIIQTECPEAFTTPEKYFSTVDTSSADRTALALEAMGIQDATLFQAPSVEDNNARKRKNAKTSKPKKVRNAKTKED